jgi:nicotinamidase/pyrazinamidase
MNTIFWNVDTQYDFMRPEGKLPIPGAVEIEGNLEKLTRLAARKDVTVVNTADWHNKNSKELSKNPDFKTTFPKHCMQGTPGAEFVPATKPLAAVYEIDWQADSFDKKLLLSWSGIGVNIVLYKDKFDVFAGNRHANDVVKLLNPEMAVVYGVATNVCVDFAVNGLLDRNVKVYAVKDAMKELPGLPLPFEGWEKKGAILVKTDEVENYLAK